MGNGGNLLFALLPIAVGLVLVAAVLGGKLSPAARARVELIALRPLGCLLFFGAAGYFVYQLWRDATAHHEIMDTAVHAGAALVFLWFGVQLVRRSIRAYRGGPPMDGGAGGAA